MSTPEQVPAELYAGDSWAWTRELPDYPPATHTAVWYFEKADANLAVSGTTSGDLFAAAVAAATTDPYSPGDYQWRLVITRTADSARTVVEKGFVSLLANPASAGSRDWRSHARKTLQAIEAVIEGKATTDQQAVSIGGRSLSRIPWADLTLLHDRYRALVAKEEGDARIASGLPSGRRILSRMT